MKQYVKTQIMTKDAYLLIKRVDDDTMGGIWESVGGGLEEGENLIMAFNREVMEETGIVLSEYEDTFYLGTDTIFTCEETGKEYKAYLSHVTIPDTELVILSEEHSDFHWVRKDQFPAFCQYNDVDSWTKEHIKMIEESL